MGSNDFEVNILWRRQRIGGNKILLEDNGTKLFLDFGMSFGTANKYFSEFLQPRKRNGLGNFIEFGLIPDLSGLYRLDYLKHMGRSHEELGFDGVLLSGSVKSLAFIACPCRPCLIH